MATLKGTRTEINLLTSFAGESQARNRYTFFASVEHNECWKLFKDVPLCKTEDEVDARVRPLV